MRQFVFFALFVSIAWALDQTQSPLLDSWTAAQKLCTELATSKPEITLLPNDIAYQKKQSSLFSRLQTELEPACRLIPSSEKDLQEVYSSLVQASIPFAVTAGGHAWNAGFSSIDSSGVAIDLSRFDKIDVDTEHQTVRLGAGLRWGQVYRYLEAYGLTAPGGRDADVGVSGFLLGGGLNLLQNRLGWGIDALMSVRILIPNGDVITASQDAHKLLFEAIKGSGGLLGIVTEYELRVMRQDEFYGLISSYDTDQLDKLVDTMVDLASHDREHPDASSYLCGGRMGAHSDVAWTAVSVDLNSKIVSPALEHLNKVPSIYEDGRLWNVSSFTDMMHENNPIGFRQAKSTFTFKMNAEIIKGLIREFEFASRDFALDSADSWISVGFQPLTRSHLGHSNNLLGMWSEDPEPLILFSLETRWRENDLRPQLDLETLHKKLERTAGRYLVPFQYANYASAQWQNPLASYGERSIALLRQAVETYDPHGIFSSRVRGLRKGVWMLDEFDANVVPYSDL